MRKALAEWAAASGGLLHFAEVGPRDAQVRLAVTTGNLGVRPDGQPFRGWTYYPSSSPSGGDIWLQARLRTLGYANGRKGGWVVRHEAGHALGLKHPQDGSPTLPLSFDCAPHTIMTYRTYCGDSTANGWPDELSTFPYKLGDLDGRAVRLIYGGGTRTTAAPLAGTGDPALFTRE